jgi:hypothetical protein
MLVLTEVPDDARLVLLALILMPISELTYTALDVQGWI